MGTSTFENVIFMKYKIQKLKKLAFLYKHIDNVIEKSML